MDLDERKLDLLMRALVHYRPPGRAAEVLELLGEIHQEANRKRVIAQELGPPTGKPVLVPLSGGRG